MKLLITGCAGFIGYHLAKKQLEKSEVEVVGLDNLNDYYDPSLKHSRLKTLGVATLDLKEGKISSSRTKKNFSFIKMDLQDREGISGLFKAEGFTHVCHLGAQVEVRYSLAHPQAYLDSNIQGFLISWKR